jgi:hypothetical protein
VAEKDLVPCWFMTPLEPLDTPGTRSTPPGCPLDQPNPSNPSTARIPSSDSSEKLFLGALSQTSSCPAVRGDRGSLSGFTRPTVTGIEHHETYLPRHLRPQPQEKARTNWGLVRPAPQ